MSAPNIRVYGNLEELSRAAAGEFSRLARETKPDGKPFTAALSGGSTPKPLYELLARPEFEIPWLRVHLFQVDERCVPPNDPQSNYRMIREALLDHIALPQSHVHRMAAERPDRDAAARSYEVELRGTLGVTASDWPRLDLIFLGMGDDGHTASLFPESAALDETERAVCPNWIGKLKMWRLTVTYPVLNAAAQVIFLVSGGKKAEILRDVLRSPGSSTPYPVQRVQPSSGTVTWYLDKAAARLL
ncbi:MAG TPA: 6-phosphogluconolactonase [Terriglobia bacterium]|nr:6-phosphogluconolactonase [Terriglobia bacterium]